MRTIIPPFIFDKSDDRLTFRRSWKGALVGLVICGAVLAIGIRFVASYIVDPSVPRSVGRRVVDPHVPWSRQTTGEHAVIIVLVGVVALVTICAPIAVGAGLLLDRLKPYVLDRRSNRFSKGKKVMARLDEIKEVRCLAGHGGAAGLGVHLARKAAEAVSLHRFSSARLAEPLAQLLADFLDRPILRNYEPGAHPGRGIRSVYSRSRSASTIQSSPMVAAAYVIPAELKAQYRKVRRRADGQHPWPLRLFILPHTLVGILCLFVLMPGVLLWAVFGQNQNAHVDQLSTQTSGKTHTVSGYVQYTYSAFGKKHTNGTTIPYEEYLNLKAVPEPLRAIQIRSFGVPPLFYEQPIHGSSDLYAAVTGLWLFGILWCAIIAYPAKIMYYDPYVAHRLCRSGVPTEGIVTDLTLFSGKGTNYYVHFAFTAPNGLRIEKKRMTTLRQWEKLNMNGPITVLYDPAKPKRCIGYEACPYVCVAPRPR